MKVSDLFPSRFTLGRDLDGQPRVVTIQRVRGEDVYLPEERREARVFVLEVKEFPRPFILRKTLAEQIAQATGEEEVERWPGQRIEVYPVTLNVGGVRRIGVRARAAKAESVPVATKAAAAAQLATAARLEAESPDDEDDETTDELSIDGRVYPAAIGAKDYMTFYQFAKAIGMNPAAAKQLMAEHENNAESAYAAARGRYVSGQVQIIP